MKISFEIMQGEFVRILKKHGFTDERAQLCARLFAEASLDGVYSHGINRFPFFIDYIRRGIVRVGSEPEIIEKFNSFERWDGNLGPGNLNAYHCMNRAIALAGEFGMGCVALKNTNHWMRGGTYGWQAAEANCLAICFTNTLPNMPPWGGLDKKVGNNPLVIAVPRKEGHIVLDMAMSMFSYGKLDMYRKEHKQLPFPGGFDTNGRLSTDPDEIFSSGRLLPIGYWKGSGLAMMLDLLAAILSGGDTTSRLDHSGDEYGVSQVFIVWSIETVHAASVAESITSEVVDFLHTAEPAEEGGEICYPGERTIRNRRDNLKNGIPVHEDVWEKILAL